VNAKVVEFRNQFTKTLEECERFCYAVRAREFQVESIETLEALDAKIAALKAEMVEAKDEDAANCLLSLSFAAKALCYELRMWVALKDGNAALAWDSLVGAEMSALDAIRAHEVSSHLEGYIEKLRLLEKLLFPPITFLSHGLIIYESKCSICGSDYGECEHIKGKAYMGEMCVRRITKAVIRERSIVTDPADKSHRMAAISDGDVMRDLLTWHVIPNLEPGDDMTRLLSALGFDEDAYLPNDS
jgi:hypothetical protein